jgi:hypothetical protein
MLIHSLSGSQPRGEWTCRPLAYVNDDGHVDAVIATFGGAAVPIGNGDGTFEGYHPYWANSSIEPAFDIAITDVIA